MWTCEVFLWQTGCNQVPEDTNEIWFFAKLSDWLVALALEPFMLEWFVGRVKQLDKQKVLTQLGIENEGKKLFKSDIGL